MIAVIMAGGKATRYGKGVEKALLLLSGKSLLEISAEKLRDPRISEVFVSVSPNTPKTSAFCNQRNLLTITTSGMGYHEDIYELINRLGSFISLNVDCPFVTSQEVASLLDAVRDTSISMVVRKEAVRFPVDEQSTFRAETGEEYVWLGLNYVTNSNRTEILVSENWLGALNVNTPADLQLAEQYAKLLPDFGR
jgi:adenosylcobinamide-phosphate guanylyltransferase